MRLKNNVYCYRQPLFLLFNHYLKQFDCNEALIKKWLQCRKKLFSTDYFFNFRVHPHNLVGKGCKNGVCTVKVSPETMRMQFQNLGIQCVKKRDIESSLRLREQIKVDPFRRK